jgi:hypothetical protein
MNGFMAIGLQGTYRQYTCADMPTWLLSRSIIMYERTCQQGVDPEKLLVAELKDPKLQAFAGRVEVDERFPWGDKAKVKLFGVILKYPEAGLEFRGYSPDDHAAAYVFADTMRTMAGLASQMTATPQPAASPQ